MQDNYTTPRLSLHRISLDDANFIFELVNTPEWKRFIGNRNIENDEAAKRYVERIVKNSSINYWVVRLRDDQTPLGIVTFIKKEYLDYPDIGFAFLARYTGKGYAQEAAKVVLDDLINDRTYAKVFATTVKDNVSSIRLLEKLGFKFSHEIEVEKESLNVYALDHR